MLRLALILVAALTLAGCGGTEQAVLERAAATAASPAGGRTVAANELVAEFNAKRITVGGAIDHAQAMLDSAASGQPMPGKSKPVASIDATLFAGAVLDMCVVVEPQLPKADEFYIIWIKMGRLAFRAADEAHQAGRLAESASLVFAGPPRWNNDGYWYQYPDHDALAAVILAKSGNRAAAIARLQGRAELKGPAEQVYQMLIGGQ
jgi:hypothetical protein